MTPPLESQHSSGVRQLARDIAERRSGMPAYLVDDETWHAALDEAKATYEPPRKTPEETR